MENNFWLKFKKPISVLAPMADVTDSAFRQIIAKYGRPHGPDVFYTEFVSADGLCHPEAMEKLKRELYFTKIEIPLVAQIFSGRPENIKEAASLIQSLGFSGLDINMGCPDRNVEKQIAGACLIKHPELARDIIIAAKEGAPNLPVAVKTRIGYSHTGELEAWAKNILSAEPAVITFHLRTRKEMSKVPAHWDLISIPRDLARGTNTLILGNGDVETPTEGNELAKKYDIAGVMIGRGIFGRPWLWAKSEPDLRKRLEICLEHTKLFAEMYLEGETNTKLFAGHTKSFHIMKKHFKAYINGFPEAGRLREKLMVTEKSEEVEKIINNFLTRNH